MPRKETDPRGEGRPPRPPLLESPGGQSLGRERPAYLDNAWRLVLTPCLRFDQAPVVVGSET